MRHDEAICRCYSTQYASVTRRNVQALHDVICKRYSTQYAGVTKRTIQVLSRRNMQALQYAIYKCYSTQYTGVTKRTMQVLQHAISRCYERNMQALQHAICRCYERNMQVLHDAICKRHSTQYAGVTNAIGYTTQHAIQLSCIHLQRCITSSLQQKFDNVGNKVFIKVYSLL